MNQNLPLLNWSLKKLLLTEPEVFNKARIKILYTILVISLVKVIIALCVAGYHHQTLQLWRGAIMLVFYASMFKLLLVNKEFVKPITHTMIILGLLLIWSNVFITVQGINIVTLQFVFMLMVSSFYFCNRRFALFYSGMAVIPLIILLVFFNRTGLDIPISPGQLASPGTFLLIILNFATLIIAHYLYQEAFNATLAAKEALNGELKQSVEAATRLAQSKSDFLSTMSHELRTPLNSVIGMTDLLREDPHNDEQKEKLDVLRFSAISLHTLINDILDYNKLDSGKLDLEKISVNLCDLMSKICASLKLQADEKGLNLRLTIDESICNKNVVTDPTRIMQIIYNIAGNGIKFTSRGEVHIALTMLASNQDEMQVRFSITDTGIGIPEDKHQYVFEPFTQASSNTTRNFGGTGLGLSIVKSLLTLVGSNIQLESKPGKGSRFYFDIRFERDADFVIAGAAAAREEYDLSGMRILVAEDNPMNVFLIKKLCSRWGIEPAIAENGSEVIEMLRANSFDVILMDIHMPMMDGYEAAAAIRQLEDRIKSSIPIIALTASVSHDISSKLNEVGINDYVRKPFDSKELYVKLKTLHRAALKIA